MSTNLPFRVRIVSALLLLSTIIFGYEYSFEVVAFQQMNEIEHASNTVLISMLNAETGQRGFIITSDDGYLAPYQFGLNTAKDRLAELNKSVIGTDMIDNVKKVENLVSLKLDELAYTIDVLRTKGQKAAEVEVDKHLGKSYMDELRAQIDIIQSKVIDQEYQIREKASIFAPLAFVSMIFTLCSAFVLGWLVRD